MAAPPSALRFVLLIHLLLSHSIHMEGHTAFGAWQRVTQPLYLPYIFGRGLFQIVFHLLAQLTLNLWWAQDYGVVIGYQVDEYTHNWLAECLIA